MWKCEKFTNFQVISSIGFASEVFEKGGRACTENSFKSKSVKLSAFQQPTVSNLIITPSNFKLMSDKKGPLSTLENSIKIRYAAANKLLRERNHATIKGTTTHHATILLNYVDLKNVQIEPFRSQPIVCKINFFWLVEKSQKNNCEESRKAFRTTIYPEWIKFMLFIYDVENAKQCVDHKLCV